MAFGLGDMPNETGDRLSHKPLKPKLIGAASPNGDIRHLLATFHANFCNSLSRPLPSSSFHDIISRPCFGSPLMSPLRSCWTSRMSLTTSSQRFLGNLSKEAGPHPAALSQDFVLRPPFMTSSKPSCCDLLGRRPPTTAFKTSFATSQDLVSQTLLSRPLSRPPLSISFQASFRTSSHDLSLNLLSTSQDRLSRHPCRIACHDLFENLLSLPLTTSSSYGFLLACEDHQCQKTMTVTRIVTPIV